MLRRVYKLLDGVVATGAGLPLSDAFEDSTSIQGIVEGTGAVTATILVEVSNDGVHYDTLASLVLSGTSSDSDSFTTDCNFKYVRGSVTAISGTAAKAHLLMSIAHDSNS